MKYTRDRDTGARYFSTAPVPTQVARTRELPHIGVLIDYDEDGNILGFEFL